jgi:CheY-like chemotaxis protein/anti-sigma regulatory factor (Ser/Thr protein kinase)
VRLDDLFTRLRIEFEPVAQAKGLKLQFAPTTAIVQSDRRLLRRVLQNFVSNAIKYTAKGRVLVGVRYAGARLRVEIWDTGVGIAEENKSEVFREFARLESAQRSAPGLGLGLSIVERIARVLEVQVGMCSQVGVGSVFSVSLPRVTDTAPLAAQRAGDHALGGCVVCAVDNEKAVLDGLKGLLEGWGCHVIAAGSIAELEAQLDAADVKPQAMIADYHLDGEDGFGAIAAVRARFGETLPAILSTADRSEAMRAQAVAANVRVLPKPLKPAALRALLAQWRARDH